ncbi:isochorismate synthase [Streptomyces sp. Tue 6430]|nr:isochorismate synthase [Streptomyces sp. Tue 6430]
MAPSASTLYVAALPEAERSALGLASREDLLDVCRRAVAAAGERGRPVLASWATPLPPHTGALELWRRSRRAAARGLLWQSAWGGGFLVAAGTAHDIAADGEHRVAAVRIGWEELARDAVTGGGPGSGLPTGRGPLLVGGVAFAPATGPDRPPLPDALMWVPSVQIRGAGGVEGAGPVGAPVGPGAARGRGTLPHELRLNAVVDRHSDPERVSKELLHLAEQCLEPWPGDVSVGPGRDVPGAAARAGGESSGAVRLRSATELPPAEEWKGLVARAVERMRAGAFEKVVLARTVRYEAEEPFDVPAALDRLAAAYPEATLFAVRDGEHEFLGATPEYLVRLTGRTVRALGLAGTTPRGATPEEDAAHERDLTDSEKLLHEHDVVVRMLKDALAGYVERLAADPTPHVLRLANVQHLATVVEGILPASGGPGVLEFTERLHPTPALGGHPRAEALDWLARNEGFERGWYAGGVGWSDPLGQGEFAVAIRSALVSGATAAVYAGCGIVAGSDPETEYQETRAKLRSMLHALGLEEPGVPGASEAPGTREAFSMRR